jgi:hypothetical protein
MQFNDPDELEIDSREYQLPEVLRAGCVELVKARGIPFGSFRWDSGAESEPAIVFFANQARGAGLAMIKSYRLPRSRPEWEDALKFFDCVEANRLTHQEMHDLPPNQSGWQLRCFKRNRRDRNDRLSTYTCKSRAVLIRYLGNPGDRLFRAVNESLRLSTKDWILDAPRVEMRSGLKPGAVERGLRKNERSEINASIAQGLLRLGMSTPKSAAAAKRVVSRLSTEIDALRKLPKRKSTKPDTDAAIELGCVFGHALCVAMGWTWQAIRYPRTATKYAVLSLDRAYAISAMQFVHAKLLESDPLADNTTMLLFNMIVAGRLPPSRPKRFLQLG